MNSAALTADGHKLMNDAVKAGENPPPGQLADPWNKAMERCRKAGQALLDGRLGRAVNQMNGAGPDLDNFTHMLDSIFSK